MNNPFLYDGRGRPLRGASSANVVTDPEVLNIPNGGYSEGFAGHDCTDFLIEIIVNTGNATGDVTVEKGDDWSFTNVITHDTIPVNTFRTASWNNNAPANGPFRIKNSAGQTIKAYLQKRIN